MRVAVGCSRSPRSKATADLALAKTHNSAAPSHSRRDDMKRKPQAGAPSQRQLRAAELVRHALVGIIAREDLRDPDLRGVSITIGEVRASSDLKHMTAFVSALGPGDSRLIANGLTRSASFLRGKL